MAQERLSIEQEMELRENMVSSISPDYAKYTSMIPKFQEYARNSTDKFKNRKLFTEKVINSDCGSKALVLYSQTGRRTKVISIERCHNRFCPLCSFIEQKKDTQRVEYIMQRASQVEDSALLAFTLSYPNCSGDQLNDEIKLLNTSFKKFSRQLEREGYLLGSFRKLEVTYNDDTNTFNPHLHVLFHIRKSLYFGTEYYKEADVWRQIWSRCSNREDIKNFYVRCFDPSRDTLSASFIKEYSFYSVKPSEMMHSQEVFDYMVSALKSKQVYTLGGTLLEYGLYYDENKDSLRKSKAFATCSDDHISDLFSHIGLVSFDFDSGLYYVEQFDELPRPLLMSDVEFGRLFNCSHLLSYDLFLDPFILDGFMQGASIEALLKLDVLRYLAS